MILQRRTNQNSIGDPPTLPTIRPTGTYMHTCGHMSTVHCVACVFVGACRCELHNRGALFPMPHSTLPFHPAARRATCPYTSTQRRSRELFRYLPSSKVASHRPPPLDRASDYDCKFNFVPGIHRSIQGMGYSRALVVRCS